jgi:hypothetical protein
MGDAADEAVQTKHASSSAAGGAAAKSDSNNVKYICVRLLNFRSPFPSKKPLFFLDVTKVCGAMSFDIQCLHILYSKNHL